MASTDTSTAPIPAATAALIRQGVLFVGGLAVGRGWVEADQLEGIVTILVTVGTAAWGLYKTFHRQKQIKTGEALTGQKLAA